MQQTTEELQLRIRELEKEITRLHKAVKEQRYGLHWLDVPEAFETETENKIPILEEVKDKAIVNNDCKPIHILIEGDNYHALTCLNYTHKGKIDVIYIDPPYNTGNDGFTYRDKRIQDKFPDGTTVDKNNAFRHSYWLSFMSKRLELAKRLLSDSGVIFISIDDNEIAQLKLLCDEERLFGEKNFLGNIIWEKTYSPVNLKKHFSENHDFIIAYAKDINQCVCNGLSRSSDADNRYKNLDNDPRGSWKSSDMSVGPVIKEKLYEITLPSGRRVFPPKGRCWLYTKDRFDEVLADNRIWFGKVGNAVPSVKKFLHEVKSVVTPMTIWKYTDVGHSQDAAQKLKDLFGGESLFIYPKPVELIKRIEELYSKKNSLILDFFAGSGTILHATMGLNEEDGGNRQCILVQSNENNICEDVTYERNRRIIQGYSNSKGEEIDGFGNSLKYYRTAFVGKNNPTRANDTDKVELSHKAGYLLALSENTLNEINIGTYYQVFENDQQVTAIYFQEDLSEIEQFVSNIAQYKKHTAVYIFSWSNGEEFIPLFDHLPHVAIKTIPQPILEIYRSINK